MRKPKQKRSADTLERVIESAERLLCETEAQDLTIAQVVQDSGVSVGAIYARFSDKDGVFSELGARFMRSTLTVFQTLDHARWQQLDLRDAVSEMVRINATIYREHRGILRAIMLRSRIVQSANITAAFEQYNGQVRNDIHELMRLHAPSIKHPRPQQAIDTSIDAMSSLLRDAIVLADIPAQGHDVEERVVDLICRFLVCEELR